MQGGTTEIPGTDEHKKASRQGRENRPKSIETRPWPVSRPCWGGVRGLIYRGFSRSSVTPGYHLLTLRVVRSLV